MLESTACKIASRILGISSVVLRGIFCCMLKSKKSPSISCISPAFFSCLGKLRLDLKGFHMRYRISVLRSIFCSLQMSLGHKFFFVILIGVCLFQPKRHPFHCWMTPQFLLLQIELNHDALASVELTKCSSVSKDHLGFEISLSN